MPLFTPLAEMTVPGVTGRKRSGRPIFTCEWRWLPCRDAISDGSIIRPQSFSSACSFLAQMGFAASPPNTITLVNGTGSPALVKIVGPTALTAEVPAGESRTVNVAAGEYYLLIRYGAKPDEYRYSRGDPFLVEETATSYSIITITLHAVADGNYDTESIPAEEFEERQTAAGSATQTSGPPVPPSSSVPYVPPVVPVIPYLPPAPPIPITPTPVVPTLPKLVLPGVTPSAETQTIAQYDLMAAYEAGLVSITLTGLENGAKLQVTVDRLVDAPMIVVIAPGELVFDLGMAKIAFAAETTIKLDLSTNNSGSFTTKQTGKNRITSGSATTKKARTS